MNKTINALKLAEEALEELHYSSGTVKAVTLYKSALAAIREVLQGEEDEQGNSRTITHPVVDCVSNLSNRDAVMESLAEPVKQEPVAWVDVSEQMPKPSKAVLIHYVINSPAYGGTRSGVIRALWIPAKTEESNDEDHFEYDEDTDTYYIPEGWYELVENWDEYSSVHVCEGDITHWMPLPEFPNAAPVSAKREWVDLTDDEIWEAVKNWNLKERVEGNYSLTRAVIAKFKEKNK